MTNFVKYITSIDSSIKEDDDGNVYLYGRPATVKSLLEFVPVPNNLVHGTTGYYLSIGDVQGTVQPTILDAILSGYWKYLLTAWGWSIDLLNDWAVGPSNIVRKHKDIAYMWVMDGCPVCAYNVSYVEDFLLAEVEKYNCYALIKTSEGYTLTVDGQGGDDFYVHKMEAYYYGLKAIGHWDKVQHVDSDKEDGKSE